MLNADKLPRLSGNQIIRTKDAYDQAQARQPGGNTSHPSAVRLASGDFGVDAVYLALDS